MCDFEEKKYKAEPLKFTGHVSAKEETKGFLRGYKNLEKLQESIAQEEVNVQKKREAYDKELETELDKINELKDRQTYKDNKTGSEIPYDDKKKWTGLKKKESFAHYKKRVSDRVTKQYERKKDVAGVPAAQQKQVADYYADNEIINKVNRGHVGKSLSENRKVILKRSLSAMAKLDAGKNFEIPKGISEEEKEAYQLKADNAKKAFYAFLDSVIKYGEYDGNVSLLIREGMNDAALFGNKEKEIALFIDMREKLDAAIEACSYDRSLDMQLGGYKDLLSGIGDGNLNIPKDAKQIKTGRLYDRKGKLIGMDDTTNNPLFAHEPSGNDVMQGNVGDCYLVSSLDAITSVEPQMIKDAMKDNGDGTVTVRLYMPTLEDEKKPMYFRVPKQQPYRMAAQNALWVNVMEMAYIGYRTQKKIRKDAIDAIQKKMTDAEKVEFKKANDERIIDFNAASKEKYPDRILENDTDEIEEWDYIIKMEEYIRGTKYSAKYDEMLDKELDKIENQDTAVSADIISGGHSTEFMNVFTGEVQFTKGTINETSPKNLSNLTFVYDDVMKNCVDEKSLDCMKSVPLNVEVDALKEEIKKLTDKKAEYEAEGKRLRAIGDEKAKQDFKLLNEKHKNVSNEIKKLENEKKKKSTEIQKLGAAEEVAKRIVQMHVAKYNFDDNKSKDTYQRILTRTQMEKLAKDASDDLFKDGAVDKLLSELNENDSVTITYNKIRSDKAMLAEIKSIAEGLMRAFMDNRIRTTVLNYERFSGNYTESALNTYKDIQDALDAKKIITASTYNFAREDCTREEDTDEPVFDGIVSKHGYAVVGVKTVTEEIDEKHKKVTRFVRVRNPWSRYHTEYVKNKNGKVEIRESRDATTDGINEIELNDFMERYKSVTYTDVVRKQ